MEKKTILRYLFLVLCIMVLSVTLPYMIKVISNTVTGQIMQVSETEDEKETEECTTEGEKTVSIGDPDHYVEDPYGNVLKSNEEIASYRKYEELVTGYRSYVEEFPQETSAGGDVTENEIHAFLKKDREQFFEAAAAYAYSRWGTEKKISGIRFDSIITYTDDEGKEVLQAMVEFLHSDHPETENNNMVICIFYKADGFYYFP